MRAMPMASQVVRHPLACTRLPTTGNATMNPTDSSDAVDRHRGIDAALEPVPDDRDAHHRQRALPNRARRGESKCQRGEARDTAHRGDDEAEHE